VNGFVPTIPPRNTPTTRPRTGIQPLRLGENCIPSKSVTAAHAWSSFNDRAIEKKIQQPHSLANFTTSDLGQIFLPRSCGSEHLLVLLLSVIASLPTV